MDLLTVSRLILGSRQALLLLSVSILLWAGLITVSQFSINILGSTYPIQKHHLALLFLFLSCAMFMGRMFRAWKDVLDVERNLPKLLKMSNIYLFAFDRNGLFETFSEVRGLMVDSRIVAPKESDDREHDKFLRDHLDRLDEYCFGLDPSDFRFSEDNEAVTRLRFAGDFNEGLGLRKSLNLSGFGYIENARQSGVSSRFLVISNKQAMRGNLETSMRTVFSTRTSISVSLMQFVNTLGSGRYFKFDVVFTFKRRGIFSKWSAGPILMFLDSIEKDGQGKLIFESSRKLLLGYGGIEK